MGRLGLVALLLLALVSCESKLADGDTCKIPAMTEQYGGEDAPATFGPGLAAPACVRTKHDAVIVLGCPNDADGKPSACQNARADLATKVAAAGLGDTFITTGAAVQNAWVEAETLRDLLVARGVAGERVIVEPKAEHTDENIYFSSRIMQARGFANAIVVTEDVRHLVMIATCDSNCCVKLGRLTAMDFPGFETKLGHYELTPPAAAITNDECEAIQPKLMCLALADRRACADRFTLTER